MTVAGLDLVLLDLDGTLTDSAPGIVASFRHAFAALDVELDPRGLARCVGPPLRDGMAVLGMPPARIEEGVLAYRSFFVPYGIFDNAVYDGVIDMLTRLRQAGLMLGLATAKRVDYAIDVLDHFGLDGYFDVVAGATADGRLAHKEEIVTEALLEAGVPGSERVVMIGDRDHDVIGARANGVVPIGVAWGYGSRHELETAGARWIVDSPAAVADLVLDLAAL
jgi:phosphoglycolate phosphatase